MKAIITKYHGPTNYKGSRISASDEDGNRVIISKDGSLDTEMAHRLAAEALCLKMRWTGKMVAGAIKTGYAFVFVA